VEMKKESFVQLAMLDMELSLTEIQLKLIDVYSVTDEKQ
tara:strand:- start:1033 stop:1149 length:117 start_codon:yes stop_codon:yes gene_type:complete